MKKNILFIILLFSQIALTQSNFSSKEKYGLKFNVGSSLTYIWQSYIFSNIVDYREYSWNLNASVSFIKKFWVGVQTIPIFTWQNKGGVITKPNYSISGIFVQYDLVQENGWRFLFESSYNVGDLFTSANNFPTRIKQLSYLGLGVSLHVPLKFLTPNFNAEIGFYNYSILNKIEFKSNYTQYILGLNYTFGKID